MLQQIAEQTLAVHSVYHCRALIAHHLTVGGIEVDGRQNLLQQRVSLRLLRSETSCILLHFMQARFQAYYDIG